jgi:hypothetical protein
VYSNGPMPSPNVLGFVYLFSASNVLSVEYAGRHLYVSLVEGCCNRLNINRVRSGNQVTPPTKIFDAELMTFV